MELPYRCEDRRKAKMENPRSIARVMSFSSISEDF
jgi:hypothetical protein